MAIQVSLAYDTTYNRTKVEVVESESTNILEMHSFSGQCSFNFTGISRDSSAEINEYIITICSGEDKLFVCNASQIVSVNGGTPPSYSDIRGFMNVINGCLPVLSNTISV